MHLASTDDKPFQVGYHSYSRCHSVSSTRPETEIVSFIILLRTSVTRSDVVRFDKRNSR